MPAKTGSRNGLSYGWALGENNWNVGMDGNLAFIDRFGVHLSFKSFLNTPPGSPAAGDCYVIGSTPTGAWVGKAGQVAVYDDGAWRYGAPRTGWQAYCEAEERQYVYDGGWTPTASEWAAATVDQAEAEAGTDTTRRAWTAQRVRQAIAAWWLTASSAFGRTLVNVVDAAAGRIALGLGTASTLTAGQADANLPTNANIRSHYGVRYKPLIKPTLLIDWLESRFVIYSASTNSFFVTEDWDAFATFLGADLTIVRAGEQAYFNALGSMQFAAANTIQCDHDPLTGQRLGPYIGSARVNVCKRSQDKTGWVLSECTDTGSTWTAPDGSAQPIFIASGNAASHRITMPHVTSALGTASAPYSWFVTIPDGSDAQRLVLRGRAIVGGNESGQAVSVSISGTGENASFAFISSSPFGTSPPAAVTASAFAVRNCGRGVFRLSVVSALNTDAAATHYQQDISFGTTGEAAAGTANTKIGVSFGMTEQGSHASPYIPVPTDAAVTRPATTIAIAGTKFAGFYNQSEGVFEVSARLASGPIGARRLLSVTDGTLNNRNGIVADTLAISTYTMTAGSFQASLAMGTVTGDVPFRCVHSYKTNDFRAALNGGNAVADTLATVPTVDRLQVGNLNGSGQPNDYIERIAYYQRADSAANLLERSKL